MLTLCCGQTNGDNIWTLLFVAFFSVVVSIIGNSLVIRFSEIRKIKNEITKTCDKLILLNVKAYKYIALSWFHGELLKEGLNIDKKLLESETSKFRDKFIDAENAKEFQLAKLRQLNHQLFSYVLEKDLANKINIEVNELHNSDVEKSTLIFLNNLVNKCKEDKAKINTIHTDISKFVINEGNGKPLKNILALLNFIINSQL